MPGITEWPAKSSRSASAGMSTEPDAPTASMRLPRMRMVCPACAGPPVPSKRSTFSSATTGAETLR